jgi:beta-lactamase superfamily II metal-dependent hydrolase
MFTSQRSWLRVCAAIAIAASSLLSAQQQSLTIYFLDMEGGGGTLYVSPSGESMLIDAGWPGARDLDRIVAAATDAGIKGIDYFVASHFHRDHIGGVADVHARLPIRTFVDHGDPVDAQSGKSGEVLKSYVDTRGKARHLRVKPGDKVPLGGVDVQIVTARGAALTKPLPGGGAPNPLCASNLPKEEEAGDEDQRSVGLIVQHGRFRSMQLGDLTWNKESELVCPNNLLGTVDVYQTSAHGLDLSSPRALVHALRPRVVVMNNAGQKGASPEAWKMVRSSPGIDDLWQLHYSEERAGSARMQETGAVGGKGLNVADQFIANLDDKTGHFLKLSASGDGSFVVTNGRTGFSKTYSVRQ